MASLSARGAITHYTATLDQDIEGDPLIFKRRTVRAYRSDGKILERSSTWFHPDSLFPKGRKHDWGWTIKGKVKAGLTPELWAQAYRQKGWTVKKG